MAHQPPIRRSGVRAGHRCAGHRWLSAAMGIGVAAVGANAWAGTDTLAGAVTPGVSVRPDAAATVERPPPGSSRSIEVWNIDEPPTIDGRIDEDVWSLTVPSGGFWVSEFSRWPAVQTYVSVLADETFLYVAFRCYDDGAEPFAIETTRDGSLGLDDQVRIQLDAYGDHESVSTFSVNAIGTQTDDVAGGRANKIEWKGEWRAATARTDYGWSAEIAIPFSILNYRPGQSELDANFVRYHNRTREWSRWADVTPQFKIEEMGRLYGVQLPERRKADPWSIMPYVIAGSNVTDRDGVFQEQMLAGGMDIRYEPSRSATALVSLLPDFTQVERQITDIDFNYNEKGVSDPRTFFVEGAAYLGSDRRLFYSPRVPDFDAGGKVFGQVGKFRYGAMYTDAPDSRQDVVSRIALAPDRTHTVDVIYVGSDRPDLEHQTLALSTQGRQRSGLKFSLDAAVTSNRESASDEVHGALVDASLGWVGDYWSTGVTYDRYDDEFLPANGLVAATRIGTDSRSGFVNYYRDFGGDVLREATMYAGYTDRETADGRVQDRGAFLSGSFELYEFVRTTLSYSDSEFRPLVGGPGEFGDIVNDDEYWSVGIDFNTRSSKYGYGLTHAAGDLGGGEYKYSTAYVWVRLTSTLEANISAEELESLGTFRQTIVGGSWDVTPANTLFMRYVVSGNDEASRFGYRRHVSDGMDVFLVYDDEPFAPAETSVKFLWSF